MDAVLVHLSSIHHRKSLTTMEFYCGKLCKFPDDSLVFLKKKRALLLLVQNSKEAENLLLS